MEPMDGVNLKTRRRVGLLIRISLIFVTIGVVLWYTVGRVVAKVADASHNSNVGVQRDAPTADQLGPGDLQILSTEGTVDLILKGDKVMGGLSPATVAKVRAEMDKESKKESSGLGGMIAGMVKSSVASAIGMHITYPVAEIQELYFKDGHLVVVTKDGTKKENVFGDVKKDGEKKEVVFSDADAAKFTAAFKARKAELGR